MTAPNKVRTSTSLAPRHLEWLQKKAHEKDTNVSEFLRHLIEVQIEEEEKQNAKP